MTRRGFLRVLAGAAAGAAAAAAGVRAAPDIVGARRNGKSTLLEVYRSRPAGGDRHHVVTLLNENNPVIREGLPPVRWRRLNEPLARPRYGIPR